jgi:DNA-directed RNA polymerase subunit RPC12/RpoP
MTEHFKKYMAREMMKCICGCCEETFFIKSNLGSIRCPHCHSEKIVSEWIKPMVVFIPENKTIKLGD